MLNKLFLVMFFKLVMVKILRAKLRLIVVYQPVFQLQPLMKFVVQG